MVVVIFVLLAFFVFVFLDRVFLERLSQIYALKDCVPCFRVKRAWLVEKLLEIILLAPRFVSMLALIESGDGVIWPALLVRVVLVLVLA